MYQDCDVIRYLGYIILTDMRETTTYREPEVIWVICIEFPPKVCKNGCTLAAKVAFNET